MEKIGLAWVLVLVLGAATVVGSAAATPLDNRADQRLARSLTVHRSDLPPGWRVEPPPKSPGSRCKAIKSVKSSTTAKAERDFSKSPQVIYSAAGVLTTVVKATRAYANVVKNAPSCLLQVPGVKDKSIGSMSFPRLGDQSRAWSLQGKIQGIGVYFDIIVVRIQRALALYLFGGIGSGDTRLEINVVRKATARA